MKPIPETGIVGAAALREASTGEFRQITELVQAALCIALGHKPEERWMVCIEALYADRAIVRKDGRFWAFPYKLTDANVVELGAKSEVIETYVPVALREALGGAVFLEAKAPDGSAWDAVLIRSGKSMNKIFYPDAVLREAAPLFEGARVYARADLEHFKGSTPDVNKLVGYIEGPRFVEGSKRDTGHLGGRLVILAGETKMRENLVDAWTRGKRDLVGLSIDALGAVEKNMREGARHARSITKVNSVDLIVEPGAGGALVRLVEAADPRETKEQGEMKLKQNMIAAIVAAFPNTPAAEVEKLDDDALMKRYTEALAPKEPAGTKNPPAQDDKDGDKPVTREELRMLEARAGARGKIASAKLPQAAKDRLQARFDGLTRFAEADVDNEIKAERDYLAKFTESGRVSMEGLERAEVEDRSKKIAGMLDAFFDPKHKEHAQTHSFKECYIEITGDKRVTGRIENMDRTRIAESVGAAFRESLDTTALADVLGDSIRRRMVADYREMGQWDVWRNACDRVPVNDFRTNERTRFGGYGDLPAVNQGAAYAALSSPADEKATYAATKRGGTEDLTLEAIKNDDVGIIRRIPIQLSRTAKRTLCKFVLDFVRTNPNLFDGVAFFHATHGNLGSTALDATTLAAARLRMKKQAELSSAARISIGPKFLWVPDDLEEAAVNLFNRSTNNDKTFVQTLSLTVMPVPYWTDANDWAISADVMDVPGIEIGFLDGQEEPELFVQDMPNVGSMFSNDKLTWKLRHVYGGGVVDFRGWDKSVVA